MVLELGTILDTPQLSAECMPSVDIVIVNWNTGRCLRDCLRSIEATSFDAFRIDRVVVVDNASRDGSADGHDGSIFNFILVRNQVNRGFAAACNQGARDSKADYVLFLNPDTQLFAGSIACPVEYMEAKDHRDVGICGIRLVDEAGSPATACARFPTLAAMVGRAFGLGRLFPGWFPPDLMTGGEGSDSREVDQVIGAFFLVRRQLFETLGGFDERFFVYFEEVDFSYRARAAGYRSVLVKSGLAMHYGGVSSDQVRALRLFYSLRSRLLYSRKHFTRATVIGVVMLTFAVEWPSRVLLGLVRRDLASVFEVIRAYAMLISELTHGRVKPGERSGS